MASQNPAQRNQRPSDRRARVVLPARPQSPRPQPGARRRTSRRWPLLAGALVLLAMVGAGGWLVHSGKHLAIAQQPMPRAAAPTSAAAPMREPVPKAEAVANVSAAPTPGETPPLEPTPPPARTARVVPPAAAPPMAEAKAAPDAVPAAAAEPAPAAQPKIEPKAANVEVVAKGGSVGAAFVAQHCIKCHGPDKQSGDVRLDDLPVDATKAVERWAAVRDQVRDGLMPPLKEPRPEQGQARALVAWVTAAVATRPARLPNEGNLIPHELLFGRPAVAGAGASPERIWRVAAQTYSAWLSGLFKERMGGIVQPFTLMGERGIRDYADLYTIDEPTTEVLLRNAAIVVKLQTGGGNGSTPEFRPLMNPDVAPTRAQLQAAFARQVQMATTRPATPDELARYVALYDRCAQLGDRPAAASAVLQAILMKPDALFRYETVAGRSGRQMLPPPKLEQAVSLTLGYKRNPAFADALAKTAPRGEAALKEAVASHVRGRLENSKDAEVRQRILGFFHDYFEYHKAPGIFKDPPRGFHFSPGTLVGDTDALVLHILAEDKDVFRRLLTTDWTFMNFAMRENKQTKKIEPARASLPPGPSKGQPPNDPLETIYFGVKEWPAQQPATVMENTRIGVLMQPSWLMAWSTNFDNDPVTRGRWIRERLLGGTVPNIPIGVAAMVPDEPHRTFRDRLTVTREGRCWKCHQKMDELGLPFEQFDHFGRFRTTEKVVDQAATAKNVDAKGKPLGPVYREAPLLTTGTITDSRDLKLEGPVKDPREMMRRIADSDLARQVFIRHVFRYFLGRNESLADARTLQEADKAYQASGGSFKALVVSLLTSEAFLYRTSSNGSTVASGDSK